MSKKIIAGVVGDVTAYAYAKAGGYKGTEEEFQALMAANVEAAKYADEVRAAAAAANEDKEAAAESKDAAAASQADAATSKAAAETAANYARTYTGAPRVAATAAAMTDQSLIYVYTGSETGYTAGNWYFWDGTTWTSGGVYNSTALETDETLTVSGAAADAKVTGDEIGALKSATRYSKAELGQWWDGYLINANTGKESRATTWTLGYIEVKPGMRITVKTVLSGAAGICEYSADGAFIAGYSIDDIGANGLYQFTTQGYKIGVNCRTENIGDYWISIDTFGTLTALDSYTKSRAKVTGDEIGALKSATRYSKAELGQWWDGYLINANTGKESSGTTWTLGYIEVKPGMRITVKTVLSGDAGICEYSADGAFIAGYSIDDIGANGLYQFTTQGYKIGVTCRTENIGDYWISFDSFSALVELDSYTKSRLENQVLLTNQTYVGNSVETVIDLPHYDKYNQVPIITCDAYYVKTSEIADYPRIQLRMNNARGLERNTTWYKIGNENNYEIREWRAPAFTIWQNNSVKIAIYVPTGCTLYIRKMTYRFESSIERSKNVSFNARPGTCNMVPELTIPAAQMALRHGYDTFVVIPKISSDGVWFAYHDDTWDINTTHLRNPDDTRITNTEYNGDYFSDIPFSYLSQYRYTEYGSMFSDLSLMKLEDCFEFLAKTGMKLRLSMHPQYGINTTANLSSLKRLIQKYGLLDDLTIIVNNIDSLFPVFGNDIGGYCFPNAVGASWTGTTNRVDSGLTNAIAAKTTYDIKTKISCGLWTDSLFTDKDKSITLVSEVLDNGFSAEVFTYDFQGSDGTTHKYLWSNDIEWLQSIGVTAFTDGYNTSIGLNF